MKCPDIKQAHGFQSFPVSGFSDCPRLLQWPSVDILCH